jgi:hypothetical protein
MELPNFLFRLVFSVHYDLCHICSNPFKHALQWTGQAKYVPNSRQREMNKGSGVSSAASISVGSRPQGSEMLSSMLAASSPEHQKQILGERLYPLVQKQKVLQVHYRHLLSTFEEIILSHPLLYKYEHQH